MPIGPSDVHTPGSKARTCSSRSSLNAPTHTRSTASHFFSTATSGSTAPSCFGSMLTRHVRPSAQQVLEQRNRLTTVDLGGPYDGPRQILDHPVAVGDPIEHVVVEGEQHAVGGDVDVGLDVAVAERDRVLERRHRVLGDLARSASVRERDRSGPVEEREVTAGGTRGTLPSRCQRGCIPPRAQRHGRAAVVGLHREHLVDLGVVRPRSSTADAAM